MLQNPGQLLTLGEAFYLEGIFFSKEFSGGLEMENLLKTALNLPPPVLVNTINEYCFDNESADDNLNDLNIIFLQYHAL